MKHMVWYKRYPTEFINGTVGMSLEEKGAYSLVLDLIYANGGPIVDDARWISGVCGVSVRKWNLIKVRLIFLKKIFVLDGRIMNEKARKVIDNANGILETSDDNSEIISPKSEDKPRETSPKHLDKFGETSVKHQDKSSENKDGCNKINDLYVHMRARLEENIDTDIEEKKNILKRNPEKMGSEMTLFEEQQDGDIIVLPKPKPLPDGFQGFWDVYPKKVGKAAAVRRWKEAIKSGATAQEISEGAARYAASCIGKARAYIKNPEGWLHDGRWTDVTTKLDGMSEIEIGAEVAAERSKRGLNWYDD